jgi:hypothetical protein
MREQVLINNTHFVGGNTYMYTFHKPKEFKTGSKLSLQTFSIYNQSPNITPEYKNNTFSINWLGTVYNFTIPMGYYDVPALDNFLKYCCLANNLYVTQQSGQPYYFINMIANSIQYSGQINFITIPNSAQATVLKYTLPSGASWTWPSTAVTAQITLSEGLGKTLGFTTLTLPSSASNANVSKISEVTPVLSPVYLYTCTCNLLNSSMSVFNELFFQQSLRGVGYGGLIESANTGYCELDIQPATYANIILRFYDQNYNPLKIIDNEMACVLLIDY